jgi:hypothetical protein
MKKVIKLNESDLMRIVKRVLSEQSQPEEYYIGRATAILSKGPKPTEPGAKYCFTKKHLVNDIKQEGERNIYLYKIKEGDTLGKVLGMTMQDDALYLMNPLCNLKDKNGFKVNDVIMYSLLPDM